ncbi:hypothetical protein D9M69_694930 [compost metagenome]
MQLRLCQLADTSIVRHVKIKGDYNPFDPAWEPYWEGLRVQRMKQSIWSAQRLELWLSQSGKCVLCGTDLEYEDGRHEDHHIEEVRYGGSNSLNNRVLLHSWCHRRIHALGLEVTKPVPARGL